MDYSDLNIIHLDLDAFFASVEELDNPSLKGKPLIVGGKSKHGIVTTANYEARKYGVHSAMPIFMAKQRCPHAIYIEPRKDRYGQVSKEVFDILYQLTDKVEQISIDEAFLDIKDLNADPIEITDYIRDRIGKEIGITLSFGISYNKFLAKLASDWQKPNGRTIISRDMIPEVLLPLDVDQVYGIGVKSKEKLNNIGVYTVEDLMGLSEEFLLELLGKSGREIYYRIRGIDDRLVVTTRQRKSIGTERTFDDTSDTRKLKELLRSYAKELSQNMKKKNIQGKTITIKVKYNDFKTNTRSQSLEFYTNSEDLIYELTIDLFDKLNIDRPLRLLGLTVSNLIDGRYKQISFFEE